METLNPTPHEGGKAPALRVPHDKNVTTEAGWYGLMA